MHELEDVRDPAAQLLDFEVGDQRLEALEQIVSLMTALTGGVDLDPRLTQFVPAAQPLDTVTVKTVHPQDQDHDRRALRPQAPRLGQKGLVTIPREDARGSLYA